MKIENALTKARERFERAERNVLWGDFASAAKDFDRAAKYFDIVARVAPWHLGDVNMPVVARNRRDLALKGFA